MPGLEDHVTDRRVGAGCVLGEGFRPGFVLLVLKAASTPGPRLGSRQPLSLSAMARVIPALTLAELGAPFLGISCCRGLNPFQLLLPTGPVAMVGGTCCRDLEGQCPGEHCAPIPSSQWPLDLSNDFPHFVPSAITTELPCPSQMILSGFPN